jgi:hypothetical protein
MKNIKMPAPKDESGLDGLLKQIDALAGGEPPQTPK